MKRLFITLTLTDGTDDSGTDGIIKGKDVVSLEGNDKFLLNVVSECGSSIMGAMFDFLKYDCGLSQYEVVVEPSESQSEH